MHYLANCPWFNFSGNVIGICWFFLFLWECWSASHCLPWDMVWGPLSCHMSLWVMSFRFQSDSKSTVSALRATCVWEILSLMPTPKVSAEKCLKGHHFNDPWHLSLFWVFPCTDHAMVVLKSGPFPPSRNYYILCVVDSNIIANNERMFARQTHDFRKTRKGLQ